MLYSSVVRNHPVKTEPFSSNGVTFSFRRLTDVRRRELRQSKDILGALTKIIEAQAGISSVREEMGLSEFQIRDMEKLVRAHTLTQDLAEMDRLVASGQEESASDKEVRDAISKVLDRTGRSMLSSDNSELRHAQLTLDRLHNAEMPYRRELEALHEENWLRAHMRACFISISGLDLEDSDGAPIPANMITADILMKYGPLELTAEIGEAILTEAQLSGEEKENFPQRTSSTAAAVGATPVTIVGIAAGTEDTPAVTAQGTSRS